MSEKDTRYPWKIKIKKAVFSVSLPGIEGLIGLKYKGEAALKGIIPVSVLPEEYFEICSFEKPEGKPVSAGASRAFVRIVVKKFFEFTEGIPLVLACSKRDAKVYLSLIRGDTLHVEPIWGSLSGRENFEFTFENIIGTKDDQVLCISLKTEKQGSL